MTTAPSPPPARLSLGVTGHREDNAAFAANRARITAVLDQLLDGIAAGVEAQGKALGSIAATRMHSLLADGADQIAAGAALARGWALIAPLPFGRTLNAAINARPAGGAEASALLTGTGGVSPETLARAAAIADLTDAAHCFELAERDEIIAELFLSSANDPTDVPKAQAFASACSERVALAGRVLIEQSDIVIGIWDGATQTFVGGTGHTIGTALDLGCPVIWIDARSPEAWRILRAPESLAGLVAPGEVDEGRDAALAALVADALRPAESAHGKHGKAPSDGVAALTQERWPKRSRLLSHGYRRIEALFGADSWKGRLRNLRQTYETPDAIATGSAAPMLAHARALPGLDAGFSDRLETAVLRRFAWTDGVSAYLSDTYRGGMMASFLMSPLAIVGGLAWMPLEAPQSKWAFEIFEFGLLCAIVAITLVGQRARWHGRWFETRRAAEYLRQGPMLLLLGAARPPGRWPRGAETSWPEWYARRALREVGLPAVAVTPSYLRLALGALLDDHVTGQRDYHRGKAARLAAAHHNLDRLSQISFTLAVAVVAIYLALEGAAALHLISHDVPLSISNAATWLAVLLPTYGAAVAGIRYFGDFERFSAISQVSADKLDAVHARIRLLLAAPDAALDYGRVSELAHATDDIVVSEIENWQAVFGGKHVSVPV